MRFNLMIIAALLFGFGVLTACQDAAEPLKVEKAKTDTTTAPKTDEHGHTDDAPRISLEEAKKDFDAGAAVFVDTRAEAAFKTDHIKGAVNVPMEMFEAKYKDIPTGKKIIAYCSWPSEHTSASLVSKLKEKGIANSYALVGGTKAWKDAGFPMGKIEENKPK